MELRTAGAGFDRVPAFTLPLTADQSEAVLDLAALKTQPGDYLIAFYGGAVAKYRHNPEAVPLAEAVVKKATTDVTTIEAELKKSTDDAKAAAEEKKAEADKLVAEVTARLNASKAALTAANEQLKQATAAAQPRDIVDIVVSEPIAIKVKAK